MANLLRILAVALFVVVALVAAGWLGLQVRASSFETVAPGTAAPRVALPADLPEPVMRHVRAVFGESMPQVRSAIVLGRAQVIFNGIRMSSRFRFYYDAARTAYYHDIQVTWFTLPVMRVHERFLNGQAILDVPVAGRVENDPFTNATANQGFWAETVAWVPAIVFADPRVRWEAIDATSVRMFPPNAADAEAFIVTFDPQTGLMSGVNAQRYGNSEPRTYQRWTNRTLEWAKVGESYVPTRSQTQWNDDPPWANWEVEQVVLNGDVSARIAQFGGDVP